MVCENTRPIFTAMPNADTPIQIEACDLVVAGGGIGSLVAALTAARTGARVTLLRPRQGVGAGFVSLPHDNNVLLDVGCRRFDFTQDMHALPLAHYQLGARTRPFAGHVRTFIESVLALALSPTHPPQLSYGGKLVPDFATSLDLTSLKHLVSPGDLARIIQETDNLLSSDAPSPYTLGLGRWPDLAGTRLEHASLINHGPTFHARFIEPFAQKLYADGWKDMPADLTAKIWTPLFFPRTVNQGARQVIDRARPAVTYFYPAAGHFGAFVSQLVAKVDGAENIQQISHNRLTSLANEKGQIVAAQVDGPPLHWSCPFTLGVSVDHYFDLAGIEAPVEKLPIAIVWVEIAQDDLLSDLDTVMVFDPGTPVYRVSRAGEGARDGHAILALEMTGGPNVCDAFDAPSTLARLGLLREGASLTRLRAENEVKIIAPSQTNRQNLHAARTALEARGVSPVLIGTLNDLKADMLNDQILQGLTITQAL